MIINPEVFSTRKGVRSVVAYLKERNYSSASSAPYVYMAVNKKTQEFYFGFRCANKLPPQYDLGRVYFTSSSVIKANPKEYTLHVLRIFRSKDRAYNFEQRLIRAFISNSRNLNYHWQRPGEYTMLGMKRPDLAALNRKLKSVPRIDYTFKCAHCKTLFTKALTERAYLKDYPASRKVFCGKPCATGYSIKGRSPWHAGTKGKGLMRAWNKGKPTPYAADNGRKGAAKQSAKVTGRRIAVKPDGTRYWAYPS